MQKLLKLTLALVLALMMLNFTALAEYSAAGRTTDNLRLREEPSTSARILTVARKGDAVTITQETPTVNSSGTWYAVLYNGTAGFMSASYLDIQDEQAPAAPDSADVTEAARTLVEDALTYRGTPYRYGSAGPNSFDCSGFTSYIFKKHGYTINRSSRDQFKNGTAVNKSGLIPGDLVFFTNSAGTRINHVGIYIGDGEFVHSSSGNSRFVRVDKINTGHYNSRYKGARRVL
jgi:cell wall-associated NlpC family hydrolase